MLNTMQKIIISCYPFGEEKKKKHSIAANKKEVNIDANNFSSTRFSHKMLN